METPDKINIAGLPVEIEKIEECGLVKQGSSTADIGDCEYDLLKIRLAMSLPQPMIDLNLLHEIIEFLSLHYAIRLTHDQIELIAGGMYQVLHDNKLVF